MKVLMATITATGHINPAIPLARRLVKRGHEVQWYTSSRYKKIIEATGAKYLPLKAGPDLDESRAGEFTEREKLHGMAQLKWDLKNFVIRSTIGYVEDLKQILRTFPADLLLCDMAMLASLFMSELGGPPCVVYSPVPLGVISRDTAPFGLGLLPSRSIMGRLRNRFLNWLMWYVLLRDINSEMNKVRMTLGLPPAPEPFFDIMAKRAHLYLQSGSPAFDYPRSDMADHIHYIGPLLPDPPKDFVLPTWWNELASGKPVVLITQGTLSTNPRRMVIPAMRALANEDFLVIITTTGKAEELNPGQLPSNVRLEKFIPYSLLLPHVDVMITNGGYGGTLLALSHGVPIVGSGRTEDKAEVCQRISWYGAGINLRSDAPKPERIKEAVLKVLNDTKYKQHAEALQKDFALYDAPGRAAELMEEFAGRK